MAAWNTLERLWRSKGSVEGITTAAFFGAAGIAAFVGLSPIVGAFAVGMAVASTRVIKQIGEYVSKLEIIFAPLFFAIIGTQVDLRGININMLYLAGLIVAIAIITKLVRCGIPSMIFLKDKSKAMKVGVGMISRGGCKIKLLTSGMLSLNQALGLRDLFIMFDDRIIVKAFHAQATEGYQHQIESTHAKIILTDRKAAYLGSSNHHQCSSTHCPRE